jgi:hypothetical protein
MFRFFTSPPPPSTYNAGGGGANGEKIELHHIKPVKEGGEYSLENIQPLHQICHISITHNKVIN